MGRMEQVGLASASLLPAGLCSAHSHCPNSMSKATELMSLKAGKVSCARAAWGWSVGTYSPGECVGRGRQPIPWHPIAWILRLNVPFEGE